MERSFKDQWSDFLYRHGTHNCSFCGEQKLNFSDPVQDSFAGIEVAAVVCSKCGHIEMFDIKEVKNVAKDVDKEFRDNGWR